MVAKYVFGDVAYYMRKICPVLSMKGNRAGFIIVLHSVRLRKKIYLGINWFRCALMVLPAWWGKTDDLSLFFVSAIYGFTVRVTTYAHKRNIDYYRSCELITCVLSFSAG